MGFQASPSTSQQVLKRPKPGQEDWTLCYSPRLPTSRRIFFCPGEGARGRVSAR